MNDYIARIRPVMICVLILLTAALTAGSAYAEEFAACDIPVTCRISDKIPVDLDLDFTYTLEADSDECPMPAGSDGGIKTVHMTDSGDVDFGKIVFDSPEVFHYTLRETTVNQGRFRRDSTVYHAALVADTDGSVNIIVNNDEGKKPAKIEFVNSYTPPGASPGTPPKTGDSSSAVLYAVIVLICAAGVLMLVRKKFRRGGRSREAAALAASCFAVLFMTAGIESAYAGAYPVSTISDYNEMPANYIDVSSLDFSQAEFTALNSEFVKGSMQYSQSDGDAIHQTIYWKRKKAPYFGTSDPNSSPIRNLGQTRISGENFKLRFSNAATLADGSKKDVIMLFSDLIIALSENVKGTTGSYYYYPIIKIDNELGGVYVNSGIGTSNTNSSRIAQMYSATRITTEVRIVEPGTDTLIPEKNYILGFRDLDVKDNTMESGTLEQKFASLFSEGIGLISGFNQPVYLSPGTHIVQDNWDGTPKLRGTQAGDGEIDTGFDISVKSSGFKYYWYGSYHVLQNGSNRGGSMGTSFGNSPKVSVLATAGDGGTIEKKGVKEYLVNTSTTYDYTPSPGYRVKKLTVDGSNVSFSKTGGTYTFERLTQTEGSEYDHTIDVVFEAPQRIDIWNNVKGTLGDRKKKFKYLVRLTGLDTGQELKIAENGTGVFYGMDQYGTRVSQNRFKPDTAGRADLILYIKDDQFIDIDGLPPGSKYTVMEFESDHKASYKITGDGSSPVIAKASQANSGTGALITNSETADVGDGKVTVLFINQRDLAPPTGVRDNRMPVNVAAVILAASFMLMMIPFVVSVIAVKQASLKRKRIRLKKQ